MGSWWSASVSQLGCHPLIGFCLRLLSVAAIPEALLIVMAIALAVSIRQMADCHAIIRRLTAVETLRSCTHVRLARPSDGGSEGVMMAMEQAIAFASADDATPSPSLG